MTGRIRKVMLVVCVGATALVGIQATRSGATPTTTLIKDVEIAAPPSGDFAGAASGDGWDVMFYGDRVFNIFHHQVDFNVDCHLQSDGSHCDVIDGDSQWPKTIESTTPVSQFTTATRSSGWIDPESGKLYAWTSRISDEAGGILCVDLTSTEANPYCGFTALTATSVHDESSSTAIGGRAIVGSEMYSYDGMTGDLVCFSTEELAPCDGQPYDLDGVPVTGHGGSDSATSAYSGFVFVHAQDGGDTGGEVTCFDPEAKTECAGDWPQSSVGVSGSGAPFPYLTTEGEVDGMCMPKGSPIPCWDLEGDPFVPPVALSNAIQSSDMYNEGTVYGTRVLTTSGEHGGSDDAVYCYDFATDAACPGYPAETSNTTYLYTVTPDPVRVGCMWINADYTNGVSQIRTFDVYDGQPGCSDRVHVTDSVVIPDEDCASLGWDSLQIRDPKPADYDSATVDLVELDGTPVVDGSALAVDGSGIVDLSEITAPSTGMVFTVNFVNPEFSGNGLVIRFTWTGEDEDSCTEQATRVPGEPTITTATPDAANAALSVAFTPPSDAGTSPITDYKYSTDDGATWRLRSDGPAATSPMKITRQSSNNAAIEDGETYDVLIRAVSDDGTGLPSNSVEVEAEVTEGVHAPEDFEIIVTAHDDVEPVYLSGFTDDVTVDLETDIGELKATSNGGLDFCTCSQDTEVSVAGAQDAVNIALNTLLFYAPTTPGTGTITIAVTKDGDMAPSHTVEIDVTVALAKLATPATPTATAMSTTAVKVQFTSVANADSYTVRAYQSNGTTLVGAPHAAFTSGQQVTGLSPATTYKFSVTAVGDGTDWRDSNPSAKASAKTQTPPTVVPACSSRTPRFWQGMPTGKGSVWGPNDKRELVKVPSFDPTTKKLNKPVIGALATSSGTGSWLVSGDGGMFTKGDAKFAGSLVGKTTKGPIVSMSANSCSTGYAILTAQGSVYVFGTQKSYGSLAKVKLNFPTMAIAVTCSSKGYYIASIDGGVFAYGDAKFRGSLAGKKLTAPIMGIVPNCARTGYWLWDTDGKVVPMGTIGKYGSLPKSVTSPVVALIPTKTFKGYWLLTANGKQYNFGDAK